MRNVICYEDNYFLKRQFELFNSLYHLQSLLCITLCTLVFSTPLPSIANMFALRYLWKTYVMKHRDK